MPTRVGLDRRACEVRLNALQCLAHRLSDLVARTHRHIFIHDDLHRGVHLVAHPTCPQRLPPLHTRHCFAQAD
jgi:hypothetical protein